MYPDEEEFEEVYSGEGREDLVDNDAISSEEEAFMQGYDEDRDNTDKEPVEDKVYEDAFEKKTRRTKRRQESFDEEELEAEVTLH